MVSVLCTHHHLLHTCQHTQAGEHSQHFAADTWAGAAVLGVVLGGESSRDVWALPGTDWLKFCQSVLIDKFAFHRRC